MRMIIGFSSSSALPVSTHASVRRRRSYGSSVCVLSRFQLTPP